MVHICLITDNNYALPTMTLIKSIDFNAKYPVYIHILADNVLDSNVLLFKQLQTKNVIIEVLQVDNPYLNIGKKHWYVSNSALLKFAIPSICNDLDKILYIDSDIIVKKDLSECFNIDISNYYAGACMDIRGMINNRYHKKIGFDFYFNSGVMLLNLSKMRQDNIEEKLVEYKIKNVNSRFMDQTALNQAFDGKVLILPPEYNFMSTTLNYKAEDIERVCHISNADIKKMIKKPAILHLTTEIKPWKTKKAKMFSLWNFYFKKLPNSQLKQSEQAFLNSSNCYIKQVLKAHKYNTQVVKRIKKILFENKQKRILIWGASIFTKNFIKKHDIEIDNIIGIVDVNKSLKGNYIGKYMIYSMDDIRKLSPDCVLYMVKNQHQTRYKEVKEFLKNNYSDIYLYYDVFN